MLYSMSMSNVNFNLEKYLIKIKNILFYLFLISGIKLINNMQIVKTKKHTVIFKKFQNICIFSNILIA